MRISPINLFNLNGCNCPPKRKEMNIFARNNAADSVSFSGHKSALKEQNSYNLEKRNNATLAQGGDNRLDAKSKNVLAELDRRTNEVVEKANAVNLKAKEVLSSVINSVLIGNFDRGDMQKDGSYDAAITKNGKTFFAHVTNDNTVDTIYAHTVDNNTGASKTEKYTYDRKTQILSEYKESDDNGLCAFKFNKYTIEGEKRPADSRKHIKEEFHIDYGNEGEIVTARFTNPYYNGTSETRTIQKTAVGLEHSNDVAYALTENFKGPHNSNDKDNNFMRWISYN